MQGFQIEGKPEQTSEESINPQIGESEQSAHRKVQRRKGNAKQHVRRKNCRNAQARTREKTAKRLRQIVQDAARRPAADADEKEIELIGHLFK